MGKTGPCLQGVPEGVGNASQLSPEEREDGMERKRQESMRRGSFNSQPLHLPASVSSFRNTYSIYLSVTGEINKITYVNTF